MRPKKGVCGQDPVEAPLTFQDVAASFSDEEWELLQRWQKEMYQNVMKEIHLVFSSLGPLIASSVFSLRPKESEDLGTMDHQEIEIWGSISSPTRREGGAKSKCQKNKKSGFVACGLPLVVTLEAGCSIQEKSEGGEASETGALLMGNHYLKNNKESDEPEGPLGPSTDAHILNSEYVVKKEEEVGSRFMDPKDAKIQGRDVGSRLEHAGVSSNVLFNIKREEDPYGMAHCESERGGLIASNASAVISRPESHGKTQSTCVFGAVFQPQNPGAGMSRPEPLVQTPSTGAGICRPESLGKTPSTGVVGAEFQPRNPGFPFQGIEGNGHLNEYQCTEKEVSAICLNSVTVPAPAASFGINEEGETYPIDMQHYQRREVFNSLSGNRTKARKKNVGNALKCKDKLPECESSSKKVKSESPETVPTNQNSHTGHQRTQATEGRYTCTECGKSFFAMSNLQRHERIHTGERPYQCILCGKSFNQKEVLLRHQKMHTGERPYQCSVCNKRFHLKHHLLAHQKIHSKADPRLSDSVTARDMCYQSFIHQSNCKQTISPPEG
ncbi:uncharacterized protein LOC144770919 isoform X2 [Lissotriton helveticus]